MERNTTEMNWFELDRIHANINIDANTTTQNLTDMMDDVVRGGTVELNWWQVDALAQAAESDEVRSELRDTANELA
jgi:hypothetical protein